jgi:hypothetical protein
MWRQWKRWGVALIVLNEIRGATTVALILAAYWHLHHHLPF